MRLKEVVVTLSPDEAQKVLEIDLDGNPSDAIQFIRQVLAKKVREVLKTKWKPAFEAGFSPSQFREFSK